MFYVDTGQFQIVGWLPSVIDSRRSMGGLLAADALIEFARTRPDPKAPLWPNIIACLAFDTPVHAIICAYAPELTRIA